MDSQKKRVLLHQKQSPTHRTEILVKNTVFGGTEVPIVAGPCAVESREQLIEVAQTLSQSGVTCLRGGAFKPRTSPYSFQGMGEEGLKLLAEMGQEFDLAIISEVMSVEHIAIAEPYVDCFQVGSRNMQNFELLKALGRTNKPVLLKRGLSATVDEFLMSAEYIMSEGNHQVILCERGIRSFDTSTRNVLDLAAIALLKELTHLPVIADPSHATGKRTLIAPTAKAAIAVGADAIMVEAHPQPEKSVSDADQALSLPELSMLIPELDAVARAVDRRLLLKRAAMPMPQQILPVTTAKRHIGVAV